MYITLYEGCAMRIVTMISGFLQLFRNYFNWTHCNIKPQFHTLLRTQDISIRSHPRPLPCPHHHPHPPGGQEDCGEGLSALSALCITGNTAETVTGSNPSLSAGADVLRDRGPGEGDGQEEPQGPFPP